ncbi:MAG: hypothetical protein PHR35_14815 [Kiritimatiellae bacterium]|nr:hypothetical protein [Kiritimatiellia bacterium]
MANRLALLLSATINPRGMRWLKRQDPAKRESDYASALSFWRRQRLPVVYCENSGTRSQAIEAQAREDGRTEILVFDDPLHDPQRGKGYGEMHIFAHALAHSRLLADADLIIKVTGRYRIPNFCAFVEPFRRADADILINLERFLTWADTRFLAFRPSFFRDYVAPQADAVDDATGNGFEPVWARAVHRCLAAGGSWRPLPEFPVIAGVYGTEDRPYLYPWRWVLFRKALCRAGIRYLRG